MSTTSNVLIRFDNLPKLAGQSNYLTWSGAWEIAYISIKWWKVIDGTTEKPAGEPTDPNEKKTPENSLSTWTDIDGQAHGGIVNSVEEHLLSTVIEATSAADAWKTLKDRFDRETATSTVTQLKSLLKLELLTKPT